jgi:hypothetical protein
MWRGIFYLHITFFFEKVNTAETRKGAWLMSSKYGLQRHTGSSLKSRQIEEREGAHYLLVQWASEREARKEEQGPTGYPWIGLLWKYSACSHFIPYPPSPAVQGIMVNRHSPARRSSTIKVSASPSLSRGKHNTGYSFARFYLLSARV